MKLNAIRILFFITFSLFFKQKSICQFSQPLIFGPYENFQKNYLVRIHVCYIYTTNNNWIQNLDLQARTESILDFLNSAYNEYGIYFSADVNSCYSNYSTCNNDLQNAVNMLDPTALTIFESPSTGFGNSYSESIPGTYVQINGQENSILHIYSPVIIHEIGHCLGLLHTHAGSDSAECNESNNNCPQDAPNGTSICYCCGDMVCDTPPNPPSSISFPNNNCAQQPTGVAEINYRNYMSYTTPSICRDKFSPEQVARMKNHLEYHPKLQDMIIQATSIPGGTTNAFSGDIIIESGTYEINDPLYMLPGAKILVKKGARLKIYDKITAACGGMWEGIVVEGTPSGSQSKASSTNASQGWVSLYAGGEIEHARIGIRLETEDGGYGGGSILYPCMGTFTNCTTSIKFGAHLSPNANAAWILSTDFLLDGEYRGGSGQQPIFIDLLFNTMVRIQGCTFNDDRPNGCAGSDSKAIGIDAKASSVNTFSNDFENLGVGIRLNQQLFGASLMNASNYTNCYQGIETIKSSKFSINDNDFLLGIPDGCSTPGESVGVTLSGNTAGLTFSKNSFSQNSSDITIGTKVQSTMGGMNNVIFDNEYTDLDIGNIALGFNGNNNGGISYACNTHSGDEDDYIVDANATVWAQQKYVDANADDAATGNLFSGGSGKGSFNNAGGNIQYFYAGSASAMNQEHFSYNNADYSGVVGTVETSNGDCADVPPCNPCDPGSIYTGIRKADFYDKRQERNDKLTILGTLTRPTEIAAMQDSILNLKQVMDRNANLVLQSYAQDTTEAATIQMDSIFAWLERSATYAGDLELANLYFFLNKLGKFDTLWAGIPTAHSLIGDDLDELDELGLVYDLLRPTIEEEESLSQLAQPILDSLAFWQGWCSEPGFLAKSVLLWNGIESVQDCDEPQKTTERALPFSKERRIKLLASNIIIYPNPANHAINLAFGQKPKHAIISLFDAHGRLYKSQQLWIDDDGYSQVFVQDLPTGLYIIKVQADVQAPHFSKLEIIH